jgi:hypothetical protein
MRAGVVNSDHVMGESFLGAISAFEGFRESDGVSASSDIVQHYSNDFKRQVLCLFMD